MVRVSVLNIFEDVGAEKIFLGNVEAARGISCSYMYVEEKTWIGFCCSNTLGSRRNKGQFS